MQIAPFYNILQQTICLLQDIYVEQVLRRMSLLEECQMTPPFLPVSMKWTHLKN